MFGGGYAPEIGVTDDNGILILQIDPSYPLTSVERTISVNGYLGRTEFVSVRAEMPVQTVTMAWLDGIAKPTLDPNQPPRTGQLGDRWIRPKDNMTMLYVPAGTFMMGSENGQEDEKPVHKVTLSHFWVDETEVTNTQFVTFINELGIQDVDGNVWIQGLSSWGAIEDQSGRYKPKDGLNNHPAVGVTWYGADAYCQWTGGQLPTEAQWEYVARSEKNFVYPWGNIFNDSFLNCWSGDCNDGYDGTSPVGRFPDGASWVEALDMAGNVWEWTADWYGDYPAISVTDPIGADFGEGRVLRGGSWGSLSIYTQTTHRNYYTPSVTVYVIGFRCMIPLE